MKLAIADPPYPPYLAERFDLVDGSARITTRSRATRYYSDHGTRSATERQADHHDAAARWDDPAEHRALLERLHNEYDGWAIATCPDGLSAYHPLPVPARLLVWHVRQVPDVLACPAPALGFPGAKPPQWTRWVLDALGYDAAQDQLDDLFPGSGSVLSAAAQGVLL